MKCLCQCERKPDTAPGQYPFSTPLCVAATSGVAAHAAFFENPFERTKAREGRLQQVEADKRGEPEPVLTMVVREHKTQENKRAGEAADDEFHLHNSILV
jgi:hypothetical protein